MAVVQVSRLKKFYQVHKKEPGLAGSVKSLFRRKYEEVKAINNISFSIDEGELIGFIGPNGAGKTTTLKCLSGLLYPTSGKVDVLGFNPWDRKPEFQKQLGKSSFGILLIKKQPEELKRLIEAVKEGWEL